jgi:Fe-S-cluster containining protein
MPTPNTKTDPTGDDDAIAVDHPRIRAVDRDIFRLSFVSNCMQHRCLCRDDGDRAKADACCQHGADVLLPEKAAILRRAAEVASVLEPKWRNPETWFDERDPEVTDAPPFETIIRTATTDLDVDDSGCVFLEHTGKRGCGLHAAALQHGFDPAEIKPSVCRLYPLSLEEGRLGLSSDFDRYSCANTGSASLYTVLRGVLADMFGEPLVRALDQIDVRVRVRRVRRLRSLG